MLRDQGVRIGQRHVALFDDIWRHIWMPQTGNAISLAGDIPAVLLHHLRPGFHLAAMVGVITDVD